MNRFISRLSTAVCSVACLLTLSDSSASVRPHLSSGTAQFVSQTDFVGSGRATHLGLYSEVGSVTFTPTGDPAVLHVDGSANYTAANGDVLRAVITGELNGATGVVTATVTYVGGTGRFANAGGTASLAGQVSPSGAISVTINGTIDY